MDKLEIKQGSFIQQTQYFIPVEIDLSVVPARLGISDFFTCPIGQRNTRSTCPTSVFTGIGQTLNVEAWRGITICVVLRSK